MHMQAIFRDYPYYGKDVAETLFDNGLLLPSGSNLSDDDRARIKTVFLNLFGKDKKRLDF